MTHPITSSMVEQETIPLLPGMVRIF